MTVSKFNESITKLLEEKLKTYSDRSLNLVTCVEIFQEIFNTIVEIIENSEAPLSNESANYLAQQYYDSILINGTQELDPNIFTTRAKLENIQTKELALLAVMLKGADFSFPVLHEIKRRS